MDCWIGKNQTHVSDGISTGEETGYSTLEPTGYLRTVGIRKQKWQVDKECGVGKNGSPTYNSQVWGGPIHRSEQGKMEKLAPGVTQLFGDD